MMKRMVMFICIIASIGSNFAEDCTSDERCCVKSAAGGCAECCPNKLDDMNEVNEMKERDYQVPSGKGKPNVQPSGNQVESGFPMEVPSGKGKPIVQVPKEIEMIGYWKCKKVLI